MKTKTKETKKRSFIGNLIEWTHDNKTFNTVGDAIGILLMTVAICSFICLTGFYEGNLEYYGLSNTNNTFNFGNAYAQDDIGAYFNQSQVANIDANNDGDGISIFDAIENKWTYIIIGILALLIFLILETYYIKNPSIVLSNSFPEFIEINATFAILSILYSMLILCLLMFILWAVALISELVILISITLVMTMIGVYILSAVGVIAAFIYVKYLLFKKYTSNLLKLKKVARKKK
jgi:hypothetical protein